eukprot:313663-Prymnesium_polylepis.1
MATVSELFLAPLPMHKSSESSPQQQSETFAVAWIDRSDGYGMAARWLGSWGGHTFACPAWTRTG